GHARALMMMKVAVRSVSGGDAADRPVVKVSWRDAHAYASWLSQHTGTHFRLPTDEEWTFAAGSRFQDDALPDSAYDGDPGHRALALYEVAAERRAATDKEPQPIGTFGANKHGLVDLAGNVWEWTDSCFVRGVIETSGAVRPTLVDCGVRVVAGRHRAYMPDFIRDARTGGCSAGALPSNLGFRLVRDDRWPDLRSSRSRARDSRCRRLQALLADERARLRRRHELPQRSRRLGRFRHRQHAGAERDVVLQLGRQRPGVIDAGNGQDDIDLLDADLGFALGHHRGDRNAVHQHGPGFELVGDA